LHAFQGTQPFFNYPRVLGHELAAELVDTGGAPGFTLGEAVTFIPYFNCGHCVACRAGKPNCCTHMQPGEFVLVIGAGPFELGIMEFARIAGGQVIALDINEQRLAFCRKKLGVAHTLNALAPDVLAQLAAITNGDMPTVVIDATGSQQAILGAFQYLAHGGRFVLVGLQKGEISFSHPEFHKREATLMSSRNATRADFEHVIASMKQGLVKPTTYITHRVRFDEVQARFARWLDPVTGVIKAMVEVA
jgi:threonine dehydrogenase-like Zn-dependent dehydrogenase